MVLRLVCPLCGKNVVVPAWTAGKVVVCAACHRQFQVPNLPAPPPSDIRTAASYAVRPAQHRRREEEEDYYEDDRYDDDLDDDDPYDDDDRPVRRSKRKRKKSRRRSSWYFGFRGRLLDILVLTTLLLLLSLLFHAVAGLIVAEGVMLILAGSIWFTIVSFQDSVATGLLCLLVPFYALVFALQNFDVAGRPIVLQFVGIAVYGVGTVVLLITQRSF